MGEREGQPRRRSSRARAYGCFARILRLAVREWGAISLEGAVHEMSGLPASRFRIKDRGLLREGYGADIVIFDPATVADEATWTEPFRRATGIARVIVNGATVTEGASRPGNCRAGCSGRDKVPPVS